MVAEGTPANSRRSSPRRSPGRVARHAVLARPGGVHELDDDVGADAIDVVVEPLLKWVGDGAAGRVRFDLIGRSVGDVNPAAVGLPTGNVGRRGRVMLVGICNAPVVFF